MQQQALEVEFNGERVHMQKGYRTQIYNPHKTVAAFPMKDRRDYEAMGYQLGTIEEPVLAGAIALGALPPGVPETFLQAWIGYSRAPPENPEDPLNPYEWESGAPGCFTDLHNRLPWRLSLGFTFP